MVNRNKILGLTVGGAVAALLFIVLTSCGQLQPSNEVIVGASCEGIQLGEVRNLQCPIGQSGNITEICSKNGWLETNRTCEVICTNPVPDTAITFDEVIKPLIADKCIDCHTVPERYDTYEVALRLARTMDYNVNLPSVNKLRMPPSPAPQLDDLDIFKKWIDQGYIRTRKCNDNPGGGGKKTLSLKYIEENILAYLNKIDAQSQKEVAFLVLSHKYNLRSSREALTQYLKGINKTLNSLSTERVLTNVVAIDKLKTIFAIDLNAYGFTRESPYLDDWDLVVKNAEFPFVSETLMEIQSLKLQIMEESWAYGMHV